MIPPLPSPIDVRIQSAPAEWWQFLAGLAPFVALMTAVIAGWIAWKSLRQKTAADDRAEWWRRAQWAFDSILSEEPGRARVGMQVLAVLAESTPSAEEIEFTCLAWRDPLAEAAEAPASCTPPHVSEGLSEGSDKELDRPVETSNNEATQEDTSNGGLG